MTLNCQQPPTIACPPQWGQDNLSAFLMDCINNQFATFVNARSDYTKLSNIDDVFIRLLDEWRNPTHIVPVTLMFRAHAAFRAASGTAMSGQSVETMPLVRSMLEFAGYAALINTDSNLATVWLNRHESEADHEAMKTIFTAGAVRRRLNELDNEIGKVFRELYERTIDFGAHPNPNGVLSSTDITKNEHGVLINQIYLHQYDQSMQQALRTTAQAGVCCLSIVTKIFPERIEALALAPAIETVKRGL